MDNEAFKLVLALLWAQELSLKSQRDLVSKMVDLAASRGDFPIALIGLNEQSDAIDNERRKILKGVCEAFGVNCASGPASD